MSGRIFLITILFGIEHLLLAQEIPNDQKLLKLTTSSALSNRDIPKNLKFKIVLKDTVRVNKSKILLVICRASGGYLHGHKWGWENQYYFAWKDHDWTVLKSFEQDHESPIGDFDSLSVVAIGKNRNALFTVFSSTGNHHLEKKIGISLIGWDGLEFIGNLDLNYSNGANADVENIADTNDCPIVHYESTYHVEKSTKDWWDIKVNRSTKVYLAGCKENGTTKKALTYSFTGEKYLTNEH